MANKEKQKAAALEKLQNILAQINDCKNRGVTPPVGLIANAEHLADLFPDPIFIKLLKDIQSSEKELVEKVAQAMSSSSWMDTKSFKELISIDPFKAAELYFEREEIKKLNNTINKIDKGELPTVSEFIDYVKVLRNEKENRDLLCPDLAVEAEKFKLEAQELADDAKDLVKEKLEKSEEHLANLGKHKVHAAVCNKHRNRRKAQGLDHSDEAIAREDTQQIANDVLDVNNILEKAEVFVKDIAALPEDFIQSFIETRNTAELKTQLETQKAADIQAAKELIERARAETAQREAVKEGEVGSIEVKIEQEKAVNKKTENDILKKKSKNQATLDAEDKKSARQASRKMRKALKENAVGTGSSSVARSKPPGKSHSYNHDI